MTPFDEFAFDRAAVRAKLAAFESLLGPSSRELSERDAIIPFFKKYRNLASLVCAFNPELTEPTLINPELEFFGDHACDLAVGQAVTGQYCFVEFEDARAESVFRRTGKGVHEWSVRFEHGFSQIVDWFYTLDDMRNTGRFREQFGTNVADYTGVLVIGRDGFMTQGQQARLRWRSMHVQIAGRRVHCVTLDQLRDKFKARVEMCDPRVPKPAKKRK